MQQQQSRRGFRRFLQTPAGKALWIAITILVVFGSFVYVEALVGIPAFLLFGLAVPIWSGLKAPRYLALSGLVVLLIVAPVANAAIAQEILQPLPPATSGTALPDGNGGAVLQNAIVSPYVGGTATNFTWTVTIYPKYLPASNATVLWLDLFVSSCPGATGNTSPACSSPYPFWAFNDSSVKGITGETNATFHFVIGSAGIWEWQMSLAFRNNTSGDTSFIPLVGDATYNGLEGPVVGSFWTVFGALILAIYVDVFLYLGAPFYFVLLIYMIFKTRERRRQEAARRASGPPPSDAAASGPSGPPASTSPGTTGLPPGSAAAAGAAAAAAAEGACPNCGAVVYANEKTCWKCGSPLTATPKDAPLPSAPKG
ncbi:MAG TPA: hypothetical protein VEL82_00685 [Thermoplasmata archaeon]|nr:hypothetical protein [Thermoplasmata archaeon]